MATDRSNPIIRQVVDSRSAVRSSSDWQRRSMTSSTSASVMAVEVASAARGVGNRPFTSMDKWFAPSTRDLIKEIDVFYSNAVNLPLPMADGAVYSIMKLNGASNQQLDNYRSQELRAYPN